jgi:hypothetical protein
MPRLLKIYFCTWVLRSKDRKEVTYFIDTLMDAIPHFFPHHKGRDIGRSLTRAILRQIAITPEEFIELLDKI